jgi:7-carboxy-7-deazaguanine synthase
VDEVRAEVERLAAPYKTTAGLPIVELTGGEPLLQKGVLPLMQALCDDGYTVLIETSGAHDISAIDPRVRRIMDLKCPSSGECSRNLYSNIAKLQTHDEIKFVIGSREDYLWTKKTLEEYHLQEHFPVLLSTVFNRIPPSQVVQWMLEDNLKVRFQLQMHKYVWDPNTKGV